MKSALIFIVISAALSLSGSVHAQGLPCMSNPFSSCGSVYGSDGVYRGELNSNRFDPNSISNPYGRYGNPYSADSLNNPYGAGNPFRGQTIPPIPPIQPVR